MTQLERDLETMNGNHRSMAKLLADTWRERDALADRVKVLEEAIRLVRSIIVDGAPTGFNPLSGDWADRLYASQAVTFAALKEARAALASERQDAALSGHDRGVTSNV